MKTSLIISYISDLTMDLPSFISSFYYSLQLIIPAATKTKIMCYDLANTFLFLIFTSHRCAKNDTIKPWKAMH